MEPFFGSHCRFRERRERCAGSNSSPRPYPRTAVAPALYQIDPSTGLATFVGSTDLGIGAVANVNGTYYAFNDLASQIESLDLANGNTSFVGNFDPAAGVIQGAMPVPTPEPASLALVGTGLVAIATRLRRARSIQRHS